MVLTFKRALKTYSTYIRYLLPLMTMTSRLDVSKPDADVSGAPDLSSEILQLPTPMSQICQKRQRDRLVRKTKVIQPSILPRTPQATSSRETGALVAGGE